MVYLEINRKNFNKGKPNPIEQLNKYLMKNKVYYENNKEEHKQRVKEYREKTNYNHKPSPEQKKEYNKQAYLRRKNKLKNLEFEKNENI